MPAARHDTIRRLVDVIKDAGESLLKGVERMVDGLAPQPVLIPVRVRRQLGGSRR